MGAWKNMKKMAICYIIRRNIYWLGSVIFLLLGVAILRGAI